MNRTLLRGTLLTCLIVLTGYVTFAADTTADKPRVLRFTRSGAVQAAFEGKQSTLDAGQTLGRWVLMSAPIPRVGASRRVRGFFSNQWAPAVGE